MEYLVLFQKYAKNPYFLSFFEYLVVTTIAQMKKMWKTPILNNFVDNLWITSFLSVKLCFIVLNKFDLQKLLLYSSSTFDQTSRQRYTRFDIYIIYA